MPKVGELMRTLRASPHRIDEKTAGALIAHAKAEGLSPVEAQDLADLLQTSLGDKFNPALRANLEAYVRGAQPALPQAVAELLPDLSKLRTLEEVASRLGADFVLLADQLGGPQFTPSQRAERLLDFLLAYAERFVAVASGEAQVNPDGQPAEVLEHGLLSQGAKLPLPKGSPIPGAPLSPGAPEREEATERFAHALRQAGFGELVEPRSRKDAVAVAAHLLASRSVAELHRRAEHLRLEHLAPARPTGPSPDLAVQRQAPAAAAAIARERVEGAPLHERAGREVDGVARSEGLRVQPWRADAGKPVIQPVGQDARPPIEEAHRKRWTDKVLGPRMLWNVLHTLRDGSVDELARREAMSQLTVAALMVLAGLTMVAIALVAL